MAKVYNTATDLITFARSSSGTALRRVGYGDEIFGDPSFDGTGDWSLPGTSVTVSGGKLTYDAVNNVRGAEQDVNIYAGRVYQVSFEVLSGTARIYLSTGKTSTTLISDLGANNYGVGVHQINVVANGNYSTIGFTFNKFFGGRACELASFSMKEVFFDRATDPLVLFNHPDDTPRIEYGSDGALKGLLIEEQRTNLFNYSNDPNLVDGGGGDAGLTVSANTEDDPAGSAAASIITAQYTNSFFGPRYTSGATGQVYTASFIVKNNGSAQSRIFVRNSVDAADITVSWDGATLTSTTDTSGSSSTEPLGGNYYKISVTYTATEGTQKPRIYPDTSDGSNSLVVYAWQLEEGSFATSYIPTSGSQQTRSADVASIPVSAFGYNPTNVVGTFYAEVSSVNSGRALTAVLGTGRAVDIIVFPSTPRVDVYSIHTSGQLYDLNNASAGINRVAAAMAENNSAACVNGGTVTTSTATGVPVVATKIDIGNYSNKSYLNGHIKSLKYYPRRLTNAQLQELTA